MPAEFHLVRDGLGKGKDVFLCTRKSNGSSIDAIFEFIVSYRAASEEGIRATIESRLLGMKSPPMSDEDARDYGKLLESCFYDEFRLYLMKGTDRLRISQERLECKLNSYFN